MKKDLKFNFSSLDERILNIELETGTKNQKHSNLNIIIIYAPTNVSGAEKKEEFYEKLILVMKKSDIVLGDFNAKLGSSVQKFGKGSINENGFLLSEAII